MAEHPAIYIATKNAGKLHELRAMFAGSGYELETYASYEDVAEGETSYAVNAQLKAEALWRQLLEAGVAAGVLGDDSGIEVAALGGRPGVLSARYGAPGITWAERRALLRREISERGAIDRRARFVCALHYIHPDGQSMAIMRHVDGSISPADAGESGFSYDPAFWYPPANMTFAEMSDKAKNAVSHRGLAVSELLAYLESL